jgi:hypothetical protein
VGTLDSERLDTNLLDQLKVADIRCAIPEFLGRPVTNSVPEFIVNSRTARRIEIALDKYLVQMVSSSSAKIFAAFSGYKRLVRTEPAISRFASYHQASVSEQQTWPNSLTRNLIRSTEGDVRLVLVNGEPLCRDVAIMKVLEPGI